MADAPVPRPVRPCPICGKPPVARFHPFCSARCADVDLNRWLTGAYVIPAGTGGAAEADPEGLRQDVDDDEAF